MPINLRRAASFVVRIWWERAVGTSPLWRGRVVHAKSGQAFYFERMEDLLAFIERWTGVPCSTENAGPPTAPELDSKSEGEE